MRNETKSMLRRGALSVLPVAFVALVSSIFTYTGDHWYNTLTMPAFTPPQWVFPVAWGVVYVSLMAALSILQGIQGFDPVRLVVPCIAVGALNILWALLFFGLHMMVPAAFALLALLIVLIYLFFAAMPFHRSVPWLLLPHILWGGFAFALNIGFILLNRM